VPLGAYGFGQKCGIVAVAHGKVHDNVALFDMVADKQLM
jgi:hypothetical protein